MTRTRRAGDVESPLIQLILITMRGSSLGPCRQHFKRNGTALYSIARRKDDTDEGEHEKVTGPTSYIRSGIYGPLFYIDFQQSKALKLYCSTPVPATRAHMASKRLPPHSRTMSTCTRTHMCRKAENVGTQQGAGATSMLMQHVMYNAYGPLCNTTDSVDNAGC